MNIVITMKKSMRVIDTTRLSQGEGILLEDNFLDISDFLNDGVLLERNVFLTTSNEMQTMKRAVTLVSVDELDSIESIVADGKPILVRTEDGSRLAASVFDALFDEDGNFSGDSGQGLCLYYESGSYETVEPTVLSFSDGFMAADDLIDWSNLDEGITWTRGAWTRTDRTLMELRPEPTVVVEPEQCKHMELATFRGALVALRTADGLVSQIEAHTELTDDEAEQVDETDGHAAEAETQDGSVDEPSETGTDETPDEQPSDSDSDEKEQFEEADDQDDEDEAEEDEASDADFADFI